MIHQLIILLIILLDCNKNILKEVELDLLEYHVLYQDLTHLKDLDYFLQIQLVIVQNGLLTQLEITQNK